MTGIPDLMKGFPEPDPEGWLSRARGALGEALERDQGEGIATRALYDSLAGISPKPPGFGDRTRGRAARAEAGGFQIRHEYADPDPTALARALGVDVEHGLEGALISLDPSIRWGGSPGTGVATGRVGAMLDCAPAFHDGTESIDPRRVPLFLEVGAGGPGALANWRVAMERRNIDVGSTRGGILCDPISTLAELGAIAQPFELAYITMADVVGHLCRSSPKMAAVGVNASVWHDAGASDVQEVGLAMATGIAYLRALERYRLSPADVAARMVFSFSLGPRPLPGLVKLRAARSLWSGVVARAGLDPTAHGMRIHARTSNRHLTLQDPWNNLLRGTCGAFAGVCAGAEGVAVAEFDAPLGIGGDFSRRMAINTLLLLRHEAGLPRVRDPAGGAYAVEVQTRELAARAWEVVQNVEERGGIVAALRDGFVQREISGRAARQAAAVVEGQAPIIGVTLHPPGPKTRAPSVRPVDREGAVRAALRRRATVLPPSATRLAQVSALRHTLKKGDPEDRVEAACRAAEAGADVGEIQAALTDGGGRIVVNPLAPTRLAAGHEGGG